ncbi:MAG: caspase family protein [Deltaproteobacteria bacterium]|nr:caspase family protein [Deltaproteobacteria bacterium]
MGYRATLACLGVVLVLGAARPCAAARVRIALVVGQDIGSSSDPVLAFAEADARRVADLLAELGGFAPERIDLLLGKGAGALRDALQRVRGRVAEIEARGDEALVLFYYSGHGGADGLHLGRETLELAALRSALEATGAAAVIGIVDACHSGRLGRAKGGKADRPFDVTLVEDPAPRGIVLISASLGDELAQESAELEGSLFTHYLLSALRGAADYDGDGRVTVREAYRAAYHQTLARSLTTSARRQHPSADMDLRGHGELVLTYLRKSSATLTLPAQAAGRYTVIDGRGYRVVAELDKRPGREMRLALPAGEYRIVKQEGDAYLAAELDLAWGGKRELRERDMRRYAYEEVARKGSVPAAAANRIFLQAEATDGLLPGMRVWAAGGLGYERLLTPSLGLGLSFGFTRQAFTFAPGNDYMALDIDHWELRARLGLSWRIDAHPCLLPTLGVALEYLCGLQTHTPAAASPGDPERRWEEQLHVFGLGPQIGLEIRLPGPWMLALWGRAMLAWTALSLTTYEQTRYIELVSSPSKGNQSIIFWGAGLAVGMEF